MQFMFLFQTRDGNIQAQVENDTPPPVPQPDYDKSSLYHISLLQQLYSFFFFTL